MTSEEQYNEIKMDVNSIVNKIKYLNNDKVIEMKNFNLNKITKL